MKKQMFTAVLLIVAGSNVYAQSSDNGINYTFAELRYVDAEAGNTDGDGFRLGGSYRIDSDFFIEASYEDVGFNDNFDISTLSAGIGYIYGYEGIDFIGLGTIIRQDPDNTSSDTGFNLAAGARKLIAPEIEVRGFFNYIDINDNSDTYIELGADYFISEQLSFGIEIDLGLDNADRFSLGGRYYF